MSRVLRWLGWILFAFISLLLIFEYSEIRSGDTYLFYLQGKSDNVGPVQFDLSPIVMGILYVVTLIFILFAYKHKRDYQALSIANIVLAIPVFLVIQNSIPLYPPFGESESPRNAELLLIWFVYLSVIVFSLFLVHVVVNYMNKRSHVVKK